VARAGRKVGSDLSIGRRLRSALPGGERKVGETAGIEASGRKGRVDLQIGALSVDDVAAVVHLELTVAGVAERAVLTHGEEAIAADGQVEIVAGRLDVALGKLLRDL